MSHLFQEIQKHAQSPITELNRYNSEDMSLEGVSTVSEVTLDGGLKPAPHLLVSMRGGMIVSKQDSTISEVTVDNEIQPPAAPRRATPRTTMIPHQEEYSEYSTSDEHEQEYGSDLPGDEDLKSDPDMIQDQTRANYAIENYEDEDEDENDESPVVRVPNDRDMLSVDNSNITGDETFFDLESMQYSEYSTQVERTTMDLPAMEESSNQDDNTIVSTSKPPPTATDKRRFWCCVGFTASLVVIAMVVAIVLVTTRNKGSASAAANNADIEYPTVGEPSSAPTIALRSSRPTPLPSLSPQAIIKDELLRVAFDGGEALRNSQSSQTRAFKWLISNKGIESFSAYVTLQLYALATLYYTTEGDNWTDSVNWLSDAPVCDWNSSQPVPTRCPKDVNILTAISLKNNELSGTLPLEIAHADQIRYLELPQNKLWGTIPVQYFTQMTDLEHIALYLNNLTGTIPTEIGSLSRLDYFDFDSNLLTGTIPTELGSATLLGTAWLNNNNFTGTVPTELALLTNLEFLYLEGNPALSGSISENLCSLSTLTITVSCGFPCSCCADDCESLSPSRAPIAISEMPFPSPVGDPASGGPISDMPMPAPVGDPVSGVPISDMPLPTPVGDPASGVPISDMPLPTPAADPAFGVPISDMPLPTPIADQPSEAPISEMPLPSPVGDPALGGPISDMPMPPPVGDPVSGVPISDMPMPAPVALDLPSEAPISLMPPPAPIAGQP
ncbi:hypothetical protein MHU86_23425 [Fragilaria crotonensis]|nr:hypothetical protein MHU86_23425 [Fragilaria crotonensis]